MAPKTPSKTTQVTEVKLPKWVDKAARENYDFAKLLGSQEYEAYTGDRVAGMDQNTMRAIRMAKDTGGISGYLNSAKGSLADANNSFGEAQGIFRNINDLAAGFKPKSVTEYNVDEYLNPYIANVESKSLDALDRSRQMAIGQNASAAGAAKAFGGSRHGIVDAVTNAESAREAGLLSANLRKEGYNNAMSLIQGDRQNEMDTFLAKTNAMGSAGQGILGAGQGYQGSASGSLEAGKTYQQGRMQDIASLLQTGNVAQMDEQRQLDAAYDQFNAKRNWDIDNLNLRLSSLGMSPYGKTESATKTSTGGSSGTDFGQLGLGLFSMLLGVSEDTMKTDKEKVGKVPGTDLDLWAWRYKKDPKTYPKVVGVMASDVEKKMPDAVVKVDGKRLINYGMIGEAMANG